MSLEHDTFATYLRRAMDSAGLPEVKDVEEATGGEVSKAVIYRWLRGEGEPSIKVLRPVARALNVPLVEMMAAARLLSPIEAGLEEDPTPPPPPLTGEDVILADDQFDDDQKAILINMLTYLRKESEQKASLRKRKHA